MQLPDWQTPRFELQAVPSGAFGVEQMPVAGAHVPSTWHTAGVGQVTALPVQVPFWQLSPVVHMLVSLHDVPLVAFTAVPQVPSAGLHVDTLQVGALHVFGFDPVHVPLWQVSVCVHMLPSLHVVPSAAFVAAPQLPSAGLQVDTLHIGALHVFGFEPMHVPFWQVSVCVQALPSLHVVPFAMFVCAEH